MVSVTGALNANHPRSTVRQTFSGTEISGGQISATCMGYPTLP